MEFLRFSGNSYSKTVIQNVFLVQDSLISNTFLTNGWIIMKFSMQIKIKNPMKVRASFQVNTARRARRGIPKDYERSQSIVYLVQLVHYQLVKRLKRLLLYLNYSQPLRDIRGQKKLTYLFLIFKVRLSQAYLAETVETLQRNFKTVQQVQQC